MHWLVRFDRATEDKVPLKFSLVYIFNSLLQVKVYNEGLEGAMFAQICNRYVVFCMNLV